MRELPLHLATPYAWVSYASFPTAPEGTALLLAFSSPLASFHHNARARALNSASLDLHRGSRKQQLPHQSLGVDRSGQE